MPDHLVIEAIEADCRLGVFDWEQRTPQPVWVDLKLAIDTARAATRDDVRGAIDYAAVVSAVRELCASRPYKLLETLAENVASLILGQFGVSEVRVRVKKKALPGVGYAAVEIERRRTRVARSRGRRAAARVGR